MRDLAALHGVARDLAIAGAFDAEKPQVRRPAHPDDLLDREVEHRMRFLRYDRDAPRALARGQLGEVVAEEGDTSRRPAAAPRRPRRTSVVLPLPFGPRIPVIVPATIVRSRPARTGVRP